MDDAEWIAQGPPGIDPDDSSEDEDEPGDDSFDLRGYDPVTDIKTRADADRFVASAIKHGRRSDYETLKGLVLGIAPAAQEERPVKRARQYGGAPGGLEGSPSLAKFHELVDAVHDFGTSKERRNQFKASIGAELPLSLMTGKETQDLNNLTDYDKLFRNMTKDRVLKFPNGEKVDPNPLYEHNLEDRVYEHVDGEPILNVRPQRYGDLRNEHLFMKWMYKRKKLPLLITLQRLRLSMDEFFARPDKALKMMIDQDMTPYNKQEDAHRHLFAWLVGLKHVTASVDDHFEIEHRGVAYKASTVPKPTGAKIEFVYCDANVYDGADIDKFEDIRYSDTPTGHVFHKDSAVKFEFKKYCGPPITWQYKNSYSYEVTSDHPGESKGLSHVINGMKTDGDVDGYDSKLVEELMKREHSTANVSVLAALKRAGDWGQIEHCKQFGIVFVTCDRFLAFYATYRNVNVLLLRHDNKLHKDQGRNRFVQYSLAMSRTRDQTKQAGGSKDTSLLNFGLVVVVALCSLIASA
jgi:hypothetical protein